MFFINAIKKLNEYILASCNLPVFKMEKVIDNNFYIDGGFYDNNPINMFFNKLNHFNIWKIYRTSRRSLYIKTSQ